MVPWWFVISAEICLQRRGFNQVLPRIPLRFSTIHLAWTKRTRNEHAITINVTINHLAHICASQDVWLPHRVSRRKRSSRQLSFLQPPAEPAGPLDTTQNQLRHVVHHHEGLVSSGWVWPWRWWLNQTFQCSASPSLRSIQQADPGTKGLDIQLTLAEKQLAMSLTDRVCVHRL